MDTTRLITDWPYPYIDDLYDAGDPSWTEVSAEIFSDQLDVVFPAAMQHNAFMVGEPWKCDDRGIPIHAVYVEVDGRYFARNDLLTKFKPSNYIREIRSQFDLDSA